MNTQFTLCKDNKDRAGRCPVHFIAYFNSLSLKYATGEKCKLTEWNANKRQFRSAYPLTEEANNHLARLTSDVLAW